MLEWLQLRQKRQPSSREGQNSSPPQLQRNKRNNIVISIPSEVPNNYQTVGTSESIVGDFTGGCGHRVTRAPGQGLTSAG